MTEKIKVKQVNLLFGPKKNTKQALDLLHKGASKAKILDETGCTAAVRDAHFSVKQGEIFVIMGLSGSGKSTLLRCVNRLIEPTEGKILLEDTEITGLNANELRKIRREKTGMVFQHFGLLPHRTVLANVAFGLEIAGMGVQERDKKSMKAIRMVGLESYEHKKITELSGGMQQRVGLARALAMDPEVLLMDEAFSALDPLIRTQMQDELLSIQEKTKQTILFITHDLDEALHLGGRIAIMKEGAIVQIGTPEEILMDPVNDYVKSFVQNVNRGKIITASALVKNGTSRKVSRESKPEDILQQMEAHELDVMAVVGEEDSFMGFVTRQGMKSLVNKNHHDIGESINSDVPTTPPNASLLEVLPEAWDNLMPVAVVDRKNRLLGVLARKALFSEISGGNLE